MESEQVKLMNSEVSGFNGKGIYNAIFGCKVCYDREYLEDIMRREDSGIYTGEDFKCLDVRKQSILYIEEVGLIGKRMLYRVIVVHTVTLNYIMEMNDYAEIGEYYADDETLFGKKMQLILQ